MEVINLSQVLLYAAVAPVIALCYFIYKKDVNREPFRLLIMIFSAGFFSAIPVIVLELILGFFLNPAKYTNFVTIFISVFISVALVEEGFKWLVTKLLGYNNKEFDEVYDIIVYAVFASLGFACIENILYVFEYGLGNAFIRAILSVPGHTCFGVLMGYYFSKAKVASINRKHDMAFSNLILSLFVPTCMHTLFDTFIFCFEYYEMMVLVFLLFDISMVIFCFSMVRKISTIQQNLNVNVSSGVIVNDGKYIQCHSDNPKDIHFCPVCGYSVHNCNFCPKCGFHIR